MSSSFSGEGITFQNKDWPVDDLGELGVEKSVPLNDTSMVRFVSRLVASKVSFSVDIQWHLTDIR